MATIAASAHDPVIRERRFFFVLSMVIVAVTVAGFSLSVVAGHSSFGAPWWVHVHGISFMGWLAIYATQNWQVLRGEIAGHRKLGYIAACYVGWLVAVGLTVNTVSAITHRIPPFFEPNVFLVMDWLTVLSFAGLTWAGVRLRNSPDWHRRLMLCGAIQVMGPGVGRLLPLPLMGTWIIWSVWAVTMLFAGVAIGFDLRTRGKVHPAYFWGVGVMTGTVALMRPLAFTPPMLSLTQYLAG